MRYASIRSMDITNGEGVGVALFVQGCPFHCHNCFNPETWDFNEGKEWTEEVKKDFITLVNKPYITRISLLGGECLADENVVEINELINDLRRLFPEKKIWMYTGYTWEEINETKTLEGQFRKNAVWQSDVLIDGRYIDAQKDISLKWKGSANQRVIDVLNTIISGEIVLYY